MHIELDRDVEKLKKEINNLKLAIKAVITSPEFISLFGKTQFLDADVIKGLLSEEEIKSNNKKGKKEFTTRRTRGDHSVDVAAIAERVVEDVFIQTFGFESRISKNIRNEDNKYVEVEEIVPTKKISDAEKEEYEIYKLNLERAKLMAVLAGYSHDLGHTPFGHDGELAINEMFKEFQKYRTEEQRALVADTRLQLFNCEYESMLGHQEGYRGIVSFEHTEQSFINFLNIISRNKIEIANKDNGGIDLDVLRMTILAHSRSRVKRIPDNIVGANRLIVHAIRIADKGDYQLVDGHEISNLIDFERLNKDDVDRRYLDRDKDVIEKKQVFINAWVKEIVNSAEVSDKFNAITELALYRQLYEDWAILYCDINSEDLNKIGRELSVEDIYRDENNSPIGIVGMFKGNKARNTCLVEKLMKYYFSHYDEIPSQLIQTIGEEEGVPTNKGKKYTAFDKSEWERIGYPEELIAIGFVSSLTNKGARELYEQLVKKRIVEGQGQGLEPISYQELEEVNRKYTSDYIKEMYRRLTEGKELSDDEKKGLENKLRQWLMEQKHTIISLTTPAGVKVEYSARLQRIDEASKDEKLEIEVAQADARRNMKRLNFYNSGGDNR